MKNKILSIKNLTVILKSSRKKIINNISFDIFENEVVALSGYNGSGKSTIIRVIAGERSDYEIYGSIKFLGNELLGNTNEQKRFIQQISYTPQKDNFEGFNTITFEEFISMSINPTNDTCIDKQKALSLIPEYFPKGNVSKKSIPAKLSGGQQRLVSIFINAVCRQKSRLFLIDEPLNNLDFENAKRISNMINLIHIKNPSAAILLVTHCKIITCIQKIFELVDGEIQSVSSDPECYNCMGIPDSCGLYSID